MTKLCEPYQLLSLMLGGLLLASQAPATSDEANVFVYHPANECELLYAIYQANTAPPTQYSIIDLSEGNVHGNIFEYNQDCESYWQNNCNPPPSLLPDGDEICYANKSSPNNELNALPEIYMSMTIANGRVQRSALSGTPTNFRIMSIISNNGSTPNVSLYKITVQNGKLLSAGNGGGINILAGIVNIESSIISNNFAASDGGGIYFSGTALNIQTSILSHNEGATGGGIAVEQLGFGTVVNSSISFNSATGASGYGGGIFSVGNGMAIYNSKFSSNSADNGGGLYNDTAPLIVSQCTFWGNQADSDGGAIANYDVASLTNNTIANNSATGSGGGIYNNDTIQDFVSNLVAENTSMGGSGSGHDFFNLGTINNESFNLIGNCDGVCGLTNGNNFDIVGSPSAQIDPGFVNGDGGELMWNGGPTETLALDAGSPAINNGDNPNNLEFDQRGPNFFRVVGARPDIGAYEVQYDF